MKTLRSYAPIFIQAILLLAGYLMINVGLANETSTTISANENLIYSENDIEVEDWMTDLSLWENNKEEKENKEATAENKASYLFDKASTIEEELEMEEWMTNASHKYWNNNNKLLQTDSEEDIEIEDWMTNLNVWNN